MDRLCKYERNLLLGNLNNAALPVIADLSLASFSHLMSMVDFVVLLTCTTGEVGGARMNEKCFTYIYFLII